MKPIHRAIRSKNLSGQKFGRLTVLWPEGKQGAGGHVVWLCVCDCGKLAHPMAFNLTTGKAESCGCLHREISRRVAATMNRTHGRSDTREYSSYCNAKKRCNNPKEIGYANYGGRGIKFLFTSFEEFFAELGPRPDGTSIDRIETNGHYAPSNVQWSTQSTQAFNRRKRR